MTQAIDLKKMLGEIVEICIDRPMGAYGENGIMYLCNYGFIPGTIAGDREEIDAYVLGVTQPLVKDYVGNFKVVGVIVRHDDIEDKLIVAPRYMNYQATVMSYLVRFAEQRYNHTIHTIQDKFVYLKGE